MNLRHAAALALVGWYLMFPPWVAQNTFDAHAPLSEWHLYTGGLGTRQKNDDPEYDSKADCESDREPIVEFYKTHPKQYDAAWFARVWSASRCILSDDPHLKLN